MKKVSHLKHPMGCMTKPKRKMKTIQQRANDYVAALGTLIQNYMENAYLAGASSVIEELKTVLSVSEDKYLRENINKMINYLEGKE